MSEEWSPITDAQAARKADQISYVGANGRPATTEAGARQSLEQSENITPQDIISLGNQLVEGSVLHQPLMPSTKFALENSLKILKGMTRIGETAKQSESIILLRTILDTISRSGSVKSDVSPKLDQVIEYLTPKVVE